MMSFESSMSLNIPSSLLVNPPPHSVITFTIINNFAHIYSKGKSHITLWAYEQYWTTSSYKAVSTLVSGRLPMPLLELCTMCMYGIYLFIFIQALTQLAELIVINEGKKLSASLCINHGGPKHNCYTHTLVILHLFPIISFLTVFHF